MQNFPLTSYVPMVIGSVIKNGDEEREVAYSEIKKGYEIAKDQYVVLEKKDLETIKLKTTNTIDIKEFVDEKELDPIMIEKSYFIAPDNKNKNDKSLLVKVAN